MTLNEQQAAGLDKVVAWYAKGEAAAASYFGATEVFRWFGYAGTGKTFTAARIPEALGINNVVFGTYTGKAASVLRRSLARYGVNFPVTTIHSAIYKPTTSKAAREALEECEREIEDLRGMVDEDALESADKAGWLQRIAHLEARLPELEANARRVRFELNPESEWSRAELIILDEVSMVNAELAADIESFGVPILVLGDPAQLPPVEGGGYYTNAKPDVMLTQIERQAIDGNPVVELATRVRTSQDAELGLRAGDYGPKAVKLLLAADMVLTYTNKTRWKLIKVIRAARGLPDHPAPGDVIMNLTNNGEQAVFNGQTFSVLKVLPSTSEILGWDLVVRDEEGRERPIKVFREGFLSQEEQERAKRSFAGGKGDRLLCTYAQVITVHKAQGSEADRVYVINETNLMRERSQARRWLYTAVTRARRQVIVTRAS